MKSDFKRYATSAKYQNVWYVTLFKTEHEIRDDTKRKLIFNDCLKKIYRDRKKLANRQLTGLNHIIKLHVTLEVTLKLTLTSTMH